MAKMTFQDIGGADLANQPQIAIDNSGQLIQKLNECQIPFPRIYELRSSSGNRLQLGLGGKFASAQFLYADEMPPYLMATVGPEDQPHDDVEFLEFDLEGTPVEVGREHCMPFDVAVKVAKYFFENDAPDPEVKWNEI